VAERQREIEVQRQAEQQELEDEVLFEEMQVKERKQREEELRRERQRVSASQLPQRVSDCRIGLCRPSRSNGMSKRQLHYSRSLQTTGGSRRTR
jgi:hypothetical protein